MTLCRSNNVVVLGLVLGCASGCGPELGAMTPDLVSGYYRAEWIETDDGPMAAVWSTDMRVGFSRGYFDTLYADPVPVRVDAGSLEVPEPAPTLEGPAADAGVYWKMRRLAWTGSSFEAEEGFAISFCESYRNTWSAAALDEATVHVTREGTGCGPGDGDSRIDDNRLEIEYVLVDPCEPPCEFVDDRETRFPGLALDDVILRESHCEC